MKIKQTVLAVILTLGFGVFFASPVALAGTCGGVNTSIINCSQGGGTDVKDSGIWGILMLVINILTAGVGVAAVGGIVYGAVLYTAAGGSPDQVKQAREIIKNTVIGILAYAFLYSFLNYLIPGGLFG